MNAALTAAEHRALLAVASGEVVRIYRANGNVLRGPKGVGSMALWKLDHRKFIADGPTTKGKLKLSSQQIVTSAGIDALRKAGAQP